MKTDKAKRIVLELIEENECSTIYELENQWRQQDVYRAYFRTYNDHWALEDEQGEVLFEKPWKQDRYSDFEHLWNWATSKNMKW